MQSQKLIDEQQVLGDLINFINKQLQTKGKIQSEAINGRDGSRTVRVIFSDILEADTFISDLYRAGIGSTTHTRGKLEKKTTQRHGADWAVYITVDQASTYLNNPSSALSAANPSSGSSSSQSSPVTSRKNSKEDLLASSQFSPRAPLQIQHAPAVQITDLHKNVVLQDVIQLNGVRGRVTAELIEGWDKKPCLRVACDTYSDAQILVKHLLQMQIGSTLNGASTQKKIQDGHTKDYKTKLYMVYISDDQVLQYIVTAKLESKLQTAELAKLTDCVYMPHTLDELLKTIPATEDAAQFACQHFLGQFCLTDDQQNTRLILLDDLQQKGVPIDYRAAQLSKLEDCITSGNAAVKVIERPFCQGAANKQESNLFRVLLPLLQLPDTLPTKTHNPRSLNWSPRMSHSHLPAIDSLLSKFFAVTVVPKDTVNTELYHETNCIGLIGDMRRAKVVRDDSSQLQGCEEAAMKIRRCGIEALFARHDQLFDRLNVLSAMYNAKKLYRFDFDLPLLVMPKGAAHKHYDVSMQCADIVAAYQQHNSNEHNLVKQGCVDFKGNGSGKQPEYTFTYDKAPCFVVCEFIKANLQFLDQKQVGQLKQVFAKEPVVADLLNQAQVVQKTQPKK